MMQAKTQILLNSYYAAFNAQNTDAILALLSHDIVHDIGQGRREFGRLAYGRFIEAMSNFCQEHIFNIEIMSNEDGSRAAAEFTILGSYGHAAQGTLPASGQTFRVPGGTFFDIRDGKITRISNYYGLQDWLAQAMPRTSPADPEVDTDSGVADMAWS
jgi:steroid delta-isomerase-like uncharacterized protein